MKVSELIQKTGLKAFNEGADKEIKGIYISDMVSDIIGIKEGHVLITLQTHKNLIAAANLVDVAAIVFSRNKIPPDDVVALANKAGIKLLGFEGDTWSLAKKLCGIGVE
ncbi:MAG: serine kinase [Candidatus Krumholzibacteriaceae bacterium]|jgi:serine kinase of HPr protein (carbohydrate metabolism regulator)